MPKGYHHLTYSQRCQISALKKIKITKEDIALTVGVSKGTISREFSRNKEADGTYDPDKAEERTRDRAIKARAEKIPIETFKVVNELLLQKWSPVQISGRMKKEGLGLISHERIYKHVWDEKKIKGSLWKNLRHQGKKYNKRGKSTAGRGCIPGRVDIKERPAIVEEKIRIGDWELDTIIGAEHKGVIVSIVDRATKYVKLLKVANKGAEEVGRAIINALKHIKEVVHTLTADNGKEFAQHQKIGEELEAKVYFATPYHSWERGLNEHTNGLVRQYLPKGMKLDHTTEEQLQEIENALNNRPRKILFFETPQEAFLRLSKAVA